jgi:hypothetical protein
MTPLIHGLSVMRSMTKEVKNAFIEIHFRSNSHKATVGTELLVSIL